MAGKFYKGNRPNETGYTDWVMKEVVKDGSNKYEVWEKENYSKGGWKGIKICAVGKVKSKANFWFAHNGERFSENRDRTLLEEKNPELFEKILNILF